MSTLKLDLKKATEEYISKAIQEHIGKEFDLAVAELNKKKNEIVAGILIGVMGSVDIQSVGDNITITIREIKK